MELIGEGYTAEVYSWQEGEILKLFRKEFPLGGIEKEYEVSKEVERLGIPIPRVGEIIEYEGRTGIVYERIVGDSLLKLITARPWSSGKYSRRLAELQYELHQCKAKGLNSYKGSLEWGIQHSTLTEDQKQAVLNRLAQLPEGDRLCHGDFHPGNVLKTKEDYIILDWMTAACGCPSMDVARTVMLIKDAGLPGNIPAIARLMINRTRRSLAQSYLRNYRKLSGMSREEIDHWRLPIIAARLSEWIPEVERNAIMKEINDTLQN
ncbi:MAG: hypothetical protein H6Q59_780 [Firmicutes bacterium]|nr:hypothetical protein [Bacillota bacterium]